MIITLILPFSPLPPQEYGLTQFPTFVYYTNFIQNKNNNDISEINQIFEIARDNLLTNN